MKVSNITNIKKVENEKKVELTDRFGRKTTRRLYVLRNNGIDRKYGICLNGDVYGFIAIWNFESIEINESNPLVFQYKYSKENMGNQNYESNSKPNEEVETEITEYEYEDGEVRHEEYQTIRACLESNVPVYLAGPAGSGKNYTVEQICKDLGWNFYFANSVQQEYKLTGFVDAGGEFHETEFYKACMDDTDCVFFLDEMDASIPEVLVLLNAAIANGYFEFPNGKVTLEHVHFVAAGNTVGSGADELYTGRMVLDQATLDRFAIIEFDYSLNIELSIAKGNTDLVNFIHQLRKVSTENGIRATFSYRCIKDLISLEGKLPLDKIMKIVVVKGIDKDTINTLRVDGISKYHRALRNIQTAA